MTDEIPTKVESVAADVKSSDGVAPPAPSKGDDDGDKIAALTERLRFFFSNANLRQDKWMRNQLETTGCLNLESLLKFHTIKKISEDKNVLAKAAQCDELKELVMYSDENGGEVRRVVPFDWKTMGDGSHLSLYIKNIPVTKEADCKKEDGAEEGKPFRPRYAVTRDEIKALFEPYGRVGIVSLRYTPKAGRNGPSNPLGVAIVEFDNEDGIAKACAELALEEDNNDGKEGEEKPCADAADSSKVEEKEGKVLELKGQTLTIKKMRPSKKFDNSPRNDKRSRDSQDGGDPAEEEPPFEPITLEWEKGCVIHMTGLSDTTCDRESIRAAVSDILGVTTDVKTSGLYVDYNRGAVEGNLRLKEAKPAEMKELITKLNDGTVKIGNEQVATAKILEGEEEEKYWEGFTKFLNDRKKMQDEEKRQKKRQKMGKGGRGRGRGRR